MMTNVSNATDEGLKAFIGAIDRQTNAKTMTLISEIQKIIDRAPADNLAEHIAYFITSREHWHRINSLDDLPDEIRNVLWCKMPIVEPPYVGTMLDENFQHDYYTHWRELPTFPIDSDPQIVSPTEYEVTKRMLQSFKESYEALTQENPHDVEPRIWRAQIDAIASKIKEFEKTVMLYENQKQHA